MSFLRVRRTITVLQIFNYYGSLNEVKIDNSFHLHHRVVFKELELLIPEIAVDLLYLGLAGGASQNLYLKEPFPFWKSPAQLFFFLKVFKDLLGQFSLSGLRLIKFWLLRWAFSLAIDESWTIFRYDYSSLNVVRLSVLVRHSIGRDFPCNQLPLYAWRRPTRRWRHYWMCSWRSCCCLNVIWAYIFPVESANGRVLGRYVNWDFFIAQVIC